MPRGTVNTYIKLEDLNRVLKPEALVKVSIAWVRELGFELENPTLVSVSEIKGYRADSFEEEEGKTDRVEIVEEEL